MNKNLLYVVHCVDTEGPLYEPLDATFERLNRIFGIDLAPTMSNLDLLKKKAINLNGMESSVAELLKPGLIETLGDWGQVDLMLDRICSGEYRNILRDSSGKGWVYNWFCLDHVGFTGDNPRRRVAGDHAVFDFYAERKEKSKSNDLIQWHYHPVPYTGHFHGSGLAYVNSSNIWEILSRKVIDRLWFPSAYRPGFHAERPDSHWFLEQWIPFDYGNQSVRGEGTNQPDLAGGRWGDWRHAPQSWVPYHPSHDDYQKRGNCKRWIARCLNMNARLRQLELTDILSAFNTVKSGGPAILAFTNHDFRDMTPEIDHVRNLIAVAKNEFNDIDFVYANAIDAFRGVIGIDAESAGLDAVIEINDENSATLKVVSKNNIFGFQPFLALKDKAGRYFWENFDFQNEFSWSTTFDFNHIPFSSLEKIGVAANSTSGVTDVLLYDIDSREWVTRKLNLT